MSEIIGSRPEGDGQHDRRKGDRRKQKVRIAAVGDFHVGEEAKGA